MTQSGSQGLVPNICKAFLGPLGTVSPASSTEPRERFSGYYGDTGLPQRGRSEEGVGKLHLSLTSWVTLGESLDTLGPPFPPL